jgi:hypothetical protein
MAGAIDLGASPEEVYAAIVGADEDEFDRVMADPEDRERVISVLMEHMAGSLRPEAGGDH